MGLKADLDEVTHHWRRSPWRVKIFLVLALFVSSSSLASLSEAVFRWKGFVLDALFFYRIWIAEPLCSLAQHVLGYPIHRSTVDAVVFYGIFFAALMRALLLRRVSPAKRATDFLVLAAAYAYMVYTTAAPAPASSSQNEPTIWILYPFYILAAFFMTRGAERVLAIAYMVIPVFLVGLVAAVSIGLSK